MSSPIVIIDNVRYRREDAEALGLIEVPEPEQVAPIDPERLAAVEAWVAAGSPAPTAPLDTDRHSSLLTAKVVGGEAEVVEQGPVTLPTQDGPAPLEAEGEPATAVEVSAAEPTPDESEGDAGKADPAGDVEPAPLSTKSATRAAPRPKK